METVTTTAAGYWAWFSVWIDEVARTARLGMSEYRDAALIVFVGLVGFLILRAILFRRAPAEANLALATRRPRFFGYATALALVCSMTLWSVFAPLASASIAMGVVSPDGNRKTISHLEGGIVRTIHVREGDTVAEGAPLVTLEDVRARSEFGELNERLMFLLASRARLEAQRDGASEIDFPGELLSMPGNGVKAVMDNQIELLASQRSAHEGRENIYRQRILQINEHTAGLQEVIAAQDEQLDLLTTEIENFQTLLDKGLTQASRLFSLQRDRAALTAEKAQTQARISENSQVVGETKIELLNLREDQVENANDQLAQIESQIAEIRSRMESRGDVLDRTVIKAPIAGTVLNLKASTVGGVLRGGETIMELVPVDAPLIIDARVKPTDIDRVRPGMNARVILSAYRQRNLPLIHGTLLSVSADRLEEDRTGVPYYLARVEVNADDIARIEEVELIPGMPTEVMILDDERSFLRYLIDPIAGSFDHSFREK